MKTYKSNLIKIIEISHRIVHSCSQCNSTRVSGIVYRK